MLQICPQSLKSALQTSNTPFVPQIFHPNLKLTILTLNIPAILQCLYTVIWGNNYSPQNIWKFTPVSYRLLEASFLCSHISFLDHSKQGIEYCWPCVPFINCSFNHPFVHSFLRSQVARFFMAWNVNWRIRTYRSRLCLFDRSILIALMGKHHTVKGNELV